MKKTLALVLSMMLLMSLCSWAAAEEPVHLKVGIAEMPTVVDFETNRLTQLLEEEGNLDLEFVTYAGNEMIEKLNVEIMSNSATLPDVLMFGSGHRPDINTVYNWALNGAVLPLTEYIKNPEVAVNFTASMIASEAPNLIGMMTTPDGEVYYLPGYARSIGNEYQAKNWIFKPWLDKLGLEIPTDAESLYQVLKAFKEKDPNGNGLQDEIPLVGNESKYIMKSLLSMFCDVGNTNYFSVKDGKVIATFTTEEYREGLRYVRKLFDEGLISPLTFTQDAAQFKALLAQETTIVGMTVTPSVAANMPVTDTRRADYLGIPPFKAADGSVLTPYYPTTPQVQFVVTSSCKNPEAAFRLGDMLCSEKYTVMNRWGEEGVDWVKPAEGAQALYASLGYAPYLEETGNTSWGSPQNQNWYNNGPYVRGYSIPGGMVWNGNPLDSEYLIAQIMPEYIGKGPKEFISTLVYTEEENDEIGDSAVTVHNYVSQSLAQFATGDMSLDTDWERYLQELNHNGLETVLKIMQAAYDRTK